MKPAGFGFVWSIQGKQIIMSYFGNVNFKVRSKKEHIWIGDVLQFKTKTDSDKLYGNETSATKEVELKSILEDKNFLASWADK